MGSGGEKRTPCENRVKTKIQKVLGDFFFQLLENGIENST